MCQREKKPDASCLPHTNFFFLLFELLFFIKHLNVKFKIIKKKNKLKEPSLKSIRVDMIDKMASC